MIVYMVMKQYVIDELRPADYQKLKEFFNDHFITSSMDSIYWLPVEPGLLTAEQSEHTDCHPLCFAIDLASSRLAFELLLRSRNRMRCSCMGYATETQRNWLIRYADTILEQLEIKA